MKTYYRGYPVASTYLYRLYNVNIEYRPNGLCYLPTGNWDNIISFVVLQSSRAVPTMWA